MENMLTEITNYLLRQGWQIAVFCVVAAVVSVALKNKSAHVRYLLWLIVLAKCLVPALYTIPLAVLPGQGVAEPVVSSAVEAPVISVEAVEVTTTGPYVSPSVLSVPPRVASFRERLAEVSAREWLGFVWIVGAVVFVLVATAKTLRTNRWLRGQRKPLSAQLQSGIEKLFADIGVADVPKVWLIEGVGQPFVWGLLRGSIYLPGNFNKVNGEKDRRGVLGHELSHVLRFDAAVNLLQVIAQAVYWFHPFVWWANKRIRAEREKCCDEMAIARFGAEAKDYSSAIVNTLIAEYEAAWPIPSLAVAGPVKNIEDRIKTIMRSGKKFYRRPTFVTIVTVVLLAALAVPTTLALTRQAGEKGDDIGRAVIEGIRANRDKFECGVLAWSRKAINERYADSNRPGRETTGEYELWWDGKKMATKYLREAVHTDPTGRYWVEKEQGGNSYDGSLLSRKPDFRDDNWLGPHITRWRGLGSQDWLIRQDSKHESTSKDWSVVDVNGVKLIRLKTKNMNETDRDYGGYSIRDYDPSKGYGLVNEEWYNPNGTQRLKHTVKLLEVISGGWFPVEVDFKFFAITDGRLINHQHYALDIEQCSFNDRAVLPKGIFKLGMEKQLKYQEKLQKYLAMELEGLSDVKEAAKADKVKLGAREAIEKFVAAAMAGDLEKAGEYAHPDRLPANQIAYITEIAKGQNLWIMAVVADDWSALAVSSVIQGDHSRVGPLVFYLDRVVVDGRDNWWVHDIDMVTPDRAERDLKRFLEKYPQAKRVVERGRRVRDLFRSYVAGGTIGEEDKAGSEEAPQFGWSDIAILLELAASDKVVEGKYWEDGREYLRSLPMSSISSYLQEQVREGMVALWLIEGLRRGQGRPGGHYRLPLNPICLKKGMSREECEKSAEIHRDVLNAYRRWWQQVSLLPAEEAALLDPLEDTDVEWVGGPWKKADTGGWGAAVEGVRCRWVGPVKAVAAGTAPVIALEVENVSDNQIIWQCRNEHTWRIYPRGSEGKGEGVYRGTYSPKFRVVPGEGVRLAGVDEARRNHEGAGSAVGYYRLGPRARMRLISEYLWVLPQAGQVKVDGYLNRRNPGGGGAYPAEMLLRNRIICPALVLEVTAGDPAAERAYEVVWSEPVDGLQAGIKYEYGKRPVGYFQNVELSILIRSISEEPIAVTFSPTGHYDDLPRVRDKRGRQQRVEMASDYERYPPGTVPLAPGFTGTIDAVAFSVCPKNYGGEERRGPILYADPGRYTITRIFRYNLDGGRELNKELTVGPIELEVAGPGEQPGDVSWGEAIGGVQIRRRAERNIFRERSESEERLHKLALAVKMYGDDHDGGLADALKELKAYYVDDEDDFEWVVENVAYLGKGKNLNVRRAGRVPVAYDKALLEKANGTNVLFLDFSVRFLDLKDLQDFGIIDETTERLESAKKLRGLGKALLVYANDEEAGKYPDTLEELREQDYINRKDLAWYLENVEYLGKGKTAADPPNAVIAYDKGLLERKRGSFTNVLFNDSHVALKDWQHLHELGISPFVFPEGAVSKINQFREALARSAWEEALSYCSDKVKARAKEYESAEAFFRDIVPVEAVIGKPDILRHPMKGDYTRLLGGLHFFPRSVTGDAEEELWWQFRVDKGDTGWIIDFGTKSIRDRLERRKKDRLRTAEYEKERQARRKAFEWKLQAVKARTRLTPLTKQFVLGEPMLFRLELVNEGEVEFLYDHQQVAVNSSMTITDENGERVPYTFGPVQTGGWYKPIKPGESAVLFDNLDISNQYDLSKAGKYKVQFNGRGLSSAISTGEKEKEPGDKMIGIQRTFPSNIVEIKVSSGGRSKKMKTAVGRVPSAAYVHKQLDQMVDLSGLGPEMSFSEALEELKNSVEPALVIVVLWRDLEEKAEIDRNTAINMDPIPAVRLGTALELLLKSISAGDAELGYVVRDGVIVIATKESLPKKLETRVYDISGLVGGAGEQMRKAAIAIESRFLMVSDNFLEDIGLDVDVNGIGGIGGEVGHISRGPFDGGLVVSKFQKEDSNSISDSAVSRTSKGHSLMLDDFQAGFLLRAVAAYQGSRVLAAPKVKVLEGEEAVLRVKTETEYISGYSELNGSSEEPEPKRDSVSTGTMIRVTPKLAPDSKDIILELGFELSNIIGFEKRMYKAKHPYEIPETEVISTEARVSVPNGGTVLIGGKKVKTENEDGQIEEKNLLVLIKAEIVEQEDTEVG